MVGTWRWFFHLWSEPRPSDLTIRLLNPPEPCVGRTTASPSKRPARSPGLHRTATLRASAHRLRLVSACISGQSSKSSRIVQSDSRRIRSSLSTPKAIRTSSRRKLVESLWLLPLPTILRQLEAHSVSLLWFVNLVFSSSDWKGSIRSPAFLTASLCAPRLERRRRRPSPAIPREPRLARRAE